MEYIKRLIDQQIQNKLQTSGAILIQGPRASGKTTTARQFTKSEIILDRSNK
jgi:predicted AAA+ superfamily ATPase